MSMDALRYLYAGSRIRPSLVERFTVRGASARGISPF